MLSRKGRRYQWSTSHDTGTAGQKVASDNIFEDRALARGLRANDDDLGEVDRVVDTDG